MRRRYRKILPRRAAGRRGAGRVGRARDTGRPVGRGESATKVQQEALKKLNIKIDIS